MPKYKTYAIMISSWDRPSLMWIQGGLLRYMGYMQNVGPYDPEYHTIVHDYGYIENTYEELGRVELEHINNFPPKEGIAAGGGWLLPDGSFYACAYSEHDSIAKFIYKYLYQKHPDCPNVSFIAYVENLGWIRVTRTYILYQDGYRATKKQIDTLFELVMLSDNERFKKRAKEGIEDLIE